MVLPRRVSLCCCMGAPENVITYHKFTATAFVSEILRLNSGLHFYCNSQDEYKLSASTRLTPVQIFCRLVTYRLCTAPDPASLFLISLILFKFSILHDINCGVTNWTMMSVGSGMRVLSLTLRSRYFSHHTRINKKKVFKVLSAATVDPLSKEFINNKQW